MKQIPTGGQGPAFELWVDRQKRSAIGASVNNGKRDLISTGKSTALQMIKSLTNLLKDNGMESNYYFLFNGQGWARAKAFHIKVMIDDPADCLRIADNESVKSHDVCISDVPAESAREEWLAEAKNRDDGYRHGHDTVYAEAGPVDTLGPWTLYFAVDAPRYIVKRTNPDGSVLVGSLSKEKPELRLSHRISTNCGTFSQSLYLGSSTLREENMQLCSIVNRISLR